LQQTELETLIYSTADEGAGELLNALNNLFPYLLQVYFLNSVSAIFQAIIKYALQCNKFNSLPALISLAGTSDMPVLPITTNALRAFLQLLAVSESRITKYVALNQQIERN
jgi:hypothetical protein